MTTSTNKLGKSIDAEKHLTSDLRVATDKFFMGNENFFPQITNDVRFITFIFIRKIRMGSYAGQSRNKRKNWKTGIQQYRLFKETLSLSCSLLVKHVIKTSIIGMNVEKKLTCRSYVNR
jgi:hypothetical protein